VDIGKKRTWKIALICWIVSATAEGFALEPNEILIIANRDSVASVQLAEYYCARRNVPNANILTLPLGSGLADTISRDDYEQKLAKPISKRLSHSQLARQIRCLLTTYGVPIKLKGRGPLADKEPELKKLQESARQQKEKIEQSQDSGSADTAKQNGDLKRKLVRLQRDIDRILGKETDASVDSELSMVLTRDYELYRWQPNALKGNLLDIGSTTLMVCRLDGPGPEIAKALVDKAMTAEKKGLKGTAYIDSRGLASDKKPYPTGYFDKCLRDLAILVRLRTDLSVEQERTERLFAPGSCPRTAIYCGWYSLSKYVEAFDFVDGAIGYHIASLEAVNLRDPNSSQWCPAMLTNGITATLGAVAEPYLNAFPEPRDFFLELFNGRCLVEAYYYTKPFNSWRMVLIGDPLYRPFKTAD
jgi:uncharacterized protein (TIGR03790 family)